MAAAGKAPVAKTTESNAAPAVEVVRTRGEPRLSAEAVRQRNKSGAFWFTAKLTLFMLAMGLFTYYFWPFGTKADPAEFKHAHIMNLNSTTFEQHVIQRDGKFKVVKFYANWCDHCKTLAPIWAEAAHQVTDPNIEFLQVECSKNGKLCRQANVRGFPAVKIFYQGAIGYARMGALNETELHELLTEGIEFTRAGQIRWEAEERERQKDAEEERKDGQKKVNTEL